MATPRKRTASRSGNPAKRAAATSKADWKGRVAPEGEALTLPSGNVALVRRPGPEALLTQGFMPDTLGAIVQEAIQSKKGMSKKQIDAIGKDPKQLSEMLDAVDRVCSTVVVEPELFWHKDFVRDAEGNETGEFRVLPAHERDPEAFYTDEVDIADRMHIFQFALGGTRKWERFREESGFGVGPVDAGEDPSAAPE